MRLRRRQQTAGTVDKIAGRVLEAVGKVTGNRKASAKGKTARGRGASRTARGRAGRRRR